jgi:hypothetical protein
MWSTIGAITGRDASGQGHLVPDLLQRGERKAGLDGPQVGQAAGEVAGLSERTQKYSASSWSAPSHAARVMVPPRVRLRRLCA